MEKFVDVYDIGHADYHSVWDLQKTVQKSLIEQKLKLRDGLISDYSLNDTLFLVEHPHVYTLGKSGKTAHLLRSQVELADINAKFVETDRGGDITYHGPGQIVGYPILDLGRHFTDIHKYLRFLEEVIIRTCGDYGITAGRMDGLTGVWADQKKLCAMGIRCSRWVTMHGFALNVNTDLSYFDHIVPCGIHNKSITSLSQLLNKPVVESDVKQKLLKHFADVFGVECKTGKRLSLDLSEKALP